MMVVTAIHTSRFAEPGKVYITPDYDHPEIEMFEFGWGPDGVTSKPAPTPDGRILICHPDDEASVRKLVGLRRLS